MANRRSGPFKGYIHDKIVDVRGCTPKRPNIHESALLRWSALAVRVPVYVMHFSLPRIDGLCVHILRFLSHRATAAAGGAVDRPEDRLQPTRQQLGTLQRRQPHVKLEQRGEQEQLGERTLRILVIGRESFLVVVIELVRRKRLDLISRTGCVTFFFCCLRSTFPSSLLMYF